MPVHLLRQIETLKKHLLAESAMVQDMLDRAIGAVSHYDAALAAQVIADDAKVDQLEIDIEEEGLKTLALDQPVAMDLRFLVAALKINNDLERIADLAESVAEQARFMAGEPRLDRWPFDLPGLCGRVRQMVGQSLDALVNEDADQARAVIEADNRVDQIHRENYILLSQLMADDIAHVRQYIHLLNVSRQLERVADHAVNIAEDVIYLSRGDIVRHTHHPFPES
ncbi:MAG: phosphate signaling complex protein PhoU [Phycisphaerales bacterium]